jgi:hypothetical protein
MTFRVAQWTTGNVGKESVKTMPRGWVRAAAR